jgi:hypothetical protein
MLRPEDTWFLDEAIDDTAELAKVLPDIRQHLVHPHDDEDLGLRSLLEQPAVFAHGWWRDQASRSGRSRHA